MRSAWIACRFASASARARPLLQHRPLDVHEEERAGRLGDAGKRRPDRADEAEDGCLAEEPRSSCEPAEYEHVVVGEHRGVGRRRREPGGEVQLSNALDRDARPLRHLRERVALAGTQREIAGEPAQRRAPACRAHLFDRHAACREPLEQLELLGRVGRIRIVEAGSLELGGGHRGRDTTPGRAWSSRPS
jgi:hypothetical protein